MNVLRKWEIPFSRNQPWGPPKEFWDFPLSPYPYKTLLKSMIPAVPSSSISFYAFHSIEFWDFPLSQNPCKTLLKSMIHQRGLGMDSSQNPQWEMNSPQILGILYIVKPFIMLAFWAVSWPGDAARIGKWILRKPQSGK